MSTIRVVRRERYTVIDKDTIRDPNLSLRALGLLVWLLDHPNNWRISSIDISRQVREGRDAIRRCMNELEAAGYLVINRTLIERGRWCTDMILYERPVDNSATEDGFPGLGATRGNAPENGESPGGTEDGFPGLGEPGLGEPGPIRKTVKEDCPAESSRDVYAGPGEIVAITDEDLDAIASARIREIIARNAKRGTDEPIVE